MTSPAKKKNAYKVAVVIPAFKEAETILDLAQRILQLDFVGRVVVVDDSPTSETVDKLANLKMESRLVVIHRKQKSGRGSAVLDGFRYVLENDEPDAILEMDADFSHAPEEIPNLVSTLREKKAGLVVGSRYLPQSQILNWPRKRRIFSGVANRLARLLLRVPISDYTNGFRVYSAPAALQILQEPLLGTGFIALSDMLVRVYYSGFAVYEIPSVFRNRIRGESSLGFGEIKNAFEGIVKICFSLQRREREKHSTKTAVQHG